MKIQTTSDIFIIGDVHGCYKTLRALINKLPKDSTIIFTGDLIDRGPMSKEVVQFIKGEGFYSVIGNHDREFCFLDKENKGRPVIKDFMFGDWGVAETMKSYIQDFDEKLYRSHIDYLSSLPLFIAVENTDLIVSHSLLHPVWKGFDESLYNEHDIDKLLYSHIINKSGYLKYNEDFKNNFFNVIGHTYFDNVFFANQYACVDTGVVYKGKLTALNYADLTIIEQKFID